MSKYVTSFTETKLRILLEAVLPLVETQLPPNSYTVQDIKETIALSKQVDQERHEALAAELAKVQVG